MTMTEQLRSINDTCDEAGAPTGLDVIERVEWLFSEIQKQTRSLMKGSDVAAIRSLVLKNGLGRNSDTTLMMVEGLVEQIQKANQPEPE